MNPEVEDALTELHGFLVGWYGPPPHSQGGPEPEDDRLPQPLASWHRMAGLWGRPLARQNHVRTVNELTREDNKVVFYVENQGVWLWAYEEVGEDPIVFDRENERRTRWESTRTRLSRFVYELTVFEAVLSADECATAVDLTHEQLDRIVERLRPVDMVPWRWPGPEHRLWIGDGLLAFAGVNDLPGTPILPDTLYDVFLAAQRPQNLAYLDALHIEWMRNTWKGI